MPSQRNPFGIGRPATNRVNIVKLDNHIAEQFRSGLNGPVPILTAEDPTPTQTYNAIPLPDGALTTKYFDDLSITSEKIAENIALPPNAVFTGSGVDGSNNMPATIGYVNPLVQLLTQQVFDINEVAETVESFSTDFSNILIELENRNPPISAINEEEWVVEPKIANANVVGSHFSDNITLSNGISLASTNSNTGTYPATTSYMRSQYSLFTQDASITSVGNLARAVLNMTDASFRIFAEEKTDTTTYENTYTNLDASAIIQQNLTQSLFSLEQPTKYTVLETAFDTSLNGLYSHDGSSALLDGLMDTVEETSAAISLDASLSLLYSSVDACLNGVVSSTFQTTQFETNLVLPQTATIAVAPTDISSNQVASTSYVKTQIQEKIAATEVIASYNAFATAIGGDASFAYTVVERVNQLDNSMVLLENRVDTISATTLLPNLFDTIERKLAIQDISMAQFSTITTLSNKIDISLNSLDASLKNTADTLNTKTVNTDSSLVLLYERQTGQISQIVSADAGYLDERLSTQVAKLVETDTSINLFLANRENNVEPVFSIANSELLLRKTQQDLSLVLLKQTVDNSANLMASFIQSDSSLADLHTEKDNLSLSLQLYGSEVDSSLVFVERNLAVDNSLVMLGENFDAIFPIYVANNATLDAKIEAIDVSLNHTITTRTTTIENMFSSYFDADISLNVLVSTLNTRETNYSALLGKIDASFQYGEDTYSLLSDYALEETVRLRNIDASFVSGASSQKQLLTHIDASLADFSQHYDFIAGNLDSSVNVVDQILGQLDYSVFDSSIGEIERQTVIADSSLAALEPGWVAGDRLSSTIEFTGPTVASLLADASGQEVANTAFLKERLREVVGSAILPLDGLNELAAAVNNIEDYTIYVSGYLGDIGLALNSINTAMADLSMNTGETFNYDASLILLDEKFGIQEGSANWVETRVYTWTSTIDSSMVSLFERNGAMDISMGALENRELQIDALVAREEAATGLYYEIKQNDASLTLLDGSLNHLDASLGNLFVDASFTIQSIEDITGRVDTSFVYIDASYGVTLAKWENIEREPRVIAADASLSSISMEIISVESGVSGYLGTTIEASSYREATDYIKERLGKIDMSMVAIENGVDASYSGVILAIANRDTNINNILSGVQQSDLSYNGAFLDASNNAADIVVIDSSGWVVSQRLDSNIVLPSGVRISGGNTSIASVADVKGAIEDIIAGAGPALDTLGEFAVALNNDASLAYVLDVRSQSTDMSYNFIAADLPPRITTQAEEYAGRIVAIEALPYSVLNNGVVDIFDNMRANDISTNLAGATIVAVDSKTAMTEIRLVTNDASTNLVDMSLSLAENATEVIDIMLGGEERIANELDASYANIRFTATGIADGLATNDISTNLLGAGIGVREASANTVIALLGTPTNFAVSGTTTTSLTCSYVEPVLRDAIGVNNYRVTARPIYGSVTTVVSDVSAGLSQVQLTGLPGGAVYDLSLAATNQYGTIVVSGVSGGTILPPPTGLVGSASTASSFTASWVSGGGALSKYSFNLINEATDVSSGDLSNNITSSNFTGLVDGTPYLVAVRAANPYVVSTDVSMIYGTVFSAPSSLAFTSRTTSSIMFSVGGTTKPYTQYNISYRPLGGSVLTTTDVSSNLNLTGLSSGRIYDVSVNIQNEFGVSAWSDTVRNSTEIVLPTLSVGTITPSRIDVSFSSALATQDCSYVLRTVPNVTQYVLAAGATSQSLTGLTQDTSYSIILDASNIFTNSSITLNSRTQPIPPVTNLAVNSTTATSITVSYSTTDIPGFTNTTITAVIGGSTFTGTGNSTGGTVSGLTSKTTYTVSVIANTSSGSSIGVSISATTLGLNDLTTTSAVSYVGITTSPPYSNPTSTHGILSLTNNSVSFSSSNTVFTSLGSTWSMQFWYRTQSVPSSQMNIISRPATNNAQLYCGNFSGFTGIFRRVNTTGQLCIYTATSVWVHITVSCANNSWTIYCDNAKRDFSVSQNASNNTVWTLMNSLAGNNVRIAEFRVWNIALSASQVSGNWNNEVASNTTGLIGLFRFRNGAILQNDI